MRSRLIFGMAFALCTAAAAPAFAQAQANPPEGITGSVAAGVAVTAGNTDTTTTNLAFNLVTDQTYRNIFKAEGLNLRSSQDGDAIVDRTQLNFRDEYQLTTRSFAFGQFRYLRDEFKGISYLVAPTAGLGYLLIDSEPTKMTVDGSLGFVIEKAPGFDKASAGALAVNESASHRLSDVATLTQGFSALWKLNDFGDSLYTFQVGIAANMTDRLQLRIEFLDLYKGEPPVPLLKNDTTLLTSIAYTF
ncbi:MAG: YdiY family protein [Vicinamibacterales bacterium]